MLKLTIVVALSFAPALVGQNGVLVTVAGNGTTGTSGVGGPAVNAALTPGAICVDRFDNIYIADPSNNRVVKIDTAGILTLFAGNGTAASAGDNGPATQASLNYPSGLAVDSQGDVFIAEANGNRVRLVNPANGIINTVAGNGAAGFSGDGGQAQNASLSRPMGLALDAAANLYIADSVNMRVRMVDRVTRIITSIVGTGVNGQSPDGTPAATANLAVPYAVSFDVQGNLLISELFGYALRRVSVTTGLLSTVAGNGGMNFNGDGQPATGAALGYMGSNVASDAAGNLYFGDATGRVRRVDGAGGIITTVAGSGAGAHSQSSSGGGGGTVTCPSGLGENGPATIATLDGPASVALMSGGRLLISDGMDCRLFGVRLPSPLLYTNTVLSLAGQSLTATVTPIGGAATPAGTVQFVEYVNFGPPLPLASAPLSAGAATLDLSILSAGSHQVMAIYMGDGACNGSGSMAVGVTGAGKATPSLGTNVPNPVVAATPVTISFNVAGSRGQATGTVQALEGSTLLATVALVNGAGSFSYLTSTPGTHQITLQYPGDNNYTPLSWPFTVYVLVPSTLSLTADANPANAGATVTFVATLSPANGTGRIAFFDNGTTIGSAQIVNGVATLPVSTLAAGTHSITAIYSGDSTVAPSTSNVYAETINITATTLTLATSGSPSTFGQGVALNATITPAAATGTVIFYDGATQLGSAPLSGGAAHLATTLLAAGTHTLTAGYSGVAGFGASTSPAVSQTVTKATPVVTVTADANPVVSPAWVNLTANLTPAWDGSSLQIMDGGNFLAGATTPTGTFGLSKPFPPGVHTFTAFCPGDANLNSATSAVLTLTVQSNTTLTLSAPSSNTVFGQPVTFTVSISPLAATGTVQFSDGAAVVGSATVVNGAASLTLPALTAGSHSIQAAYNGDGVFLASASGVWGQTVSKATSTIALVSSLNPATAGQSVMFTATILPAAATGSVQFLDGAALLATVPVSGGSASFAGTTLSAGSHSITVVYGGDANCNPVTSSVVTQTVSKAPSTTTVSAGSGTIEYGQNVDLTASVTPASATGTVQFLDGATVLVTLPVSAGAVPVVTARNLAAGTHAFTAVYSGDSAYAGSTSAVATVTVAKAASTIALSSSPNPSASGQPVVFTATLSPAAATGNVQFLDGSTVIGTSAAGNGIASIAVATLTVGTHSISAVYSGDAGYTGATSSVVPQIVNKAGSAARIVSSTNPSTYGQPVTLTATVSPGTVIGSVQFFDGSTGIGTAAVSGGIASLTVSALASGIHSITAVYGGDANHTGATSGAVSQTVNKAGTAVALASSTNPGTSGQPVTFTATVSPNSATGSVQFLDGSTVIATAAISGGLASMRTSSLAVGSHTISVLYSGDANYNPSTSAPLTEVVKVATATTLSSNANSSTYGHAVQFTASVSSHSATGTVGFFDGAALIGTGTVSFGKATFITSSLPGGSHSMTAVYSGDSTYLAGTSAGLTQTVNKATSTASVVSSLHTSIVGQAVTFTATVSPAAVTGSVQFLDGSTVLAMADLSGASASLTTSNLAAGSHKITVLYNGDGNYLSDTSGTLTQNVNKANTSTTLTSSQNPSVGGRNVTFTATVSSAGASGTVQFFDGNTSLGTAVLSTGAVTFATAALASGNHNIKAVYSGDGAFNGSTSETFRQTVN